MRLSALVASATLLLFSAQDVLGGGHGGDDDARRTRALAGLEEASAPSDSNAAALSLRGGARALDHCDVYDSTKECQCLNGIYCGGNEDSTGLDADKFEPNTLYDCDDGCYTIREHCGQHKVCSFEPCKHDDFCKSGPAPSPSPECPNDKDGYYCGNNPDVPHYLPGRDEAPVDGRLYYCKDGHYSKIDTCTNNHPVQKCKVNGGGHDECVDAHPAPAPVPPPSPACPDNKNGAYCGNNHDLPHYLPGVNEYAVHGRLYKCWDGVYSKIDTCTNNHPEQICKVNGGGHDECVDAHPPSPGPGPTPTPSPECPGNKDGYYCGNNPLVPDNLVDGVLYTCTNGHYSHQINCEDLHPPYFCHVSSSYGHDTCKELPPPLPTAAPSSAPSAFCDDDSNKDECPASPMPGPPFPVCVGTDGVDARCRAYTETGGNTGECYEATKLLLNTRMGDMDTILEHAKKFMYGVYCGEFNGCDESTGCCKPPHPCDDKDDNGVDQSCKDKKDCLVTAGGDFSKKLECEVGFVHDLQHAYVDSLDTDGAPQLNRFCDDKWYTMDISVAHQDNLVTTNTGAEFFKHESILNAFSPCCSPFGVRKCLDSTGAGITDCHDDTILCFCKSIAERFAFLGGDYKTCSDAYSHVGCSHVSETDIPFPLH